MGHLEDINGLNSSLPRRDHSLASSYMSLFVKFIQSQLLCFRELNIWLLEYS